MWGELVGTYKDKYYNLWKICRNMLEHAQMYGNMWAQNENENLLQYVRTGQGNMWGNILECVVISWILENVWDYIGICGNILEYAGSWECAGMGGTMWERVPVWECGNVNFFVPFYDWFACRCNERICFAIHVHFFAGPRKNAPLLCRVHRPPSRVWL